MKTYSKSLSILPLAVMFIATTFASAALASPPPFKIHGSFEAVEAHVVSFPTIDLDVDGVGQASVLGRFSLHENGVIDLFTLTAIGTADIVTASGDHIFTNAVNAAGPNENDPDKLTILETHTITGGTGRFCGATGTITIERILDPVTLLSEGTITGTITLL